MKTAPLPALSAREVRYSLDPATSAFVIENYNWAKAFSNFFPGIAGEWGIPLWAYYVSRGQALCSVGVRDKNGQILEFHSFNHAMARVASEGFRTFLRLDGVAVHEPFRKVEDPAVRQTMILRAGELVLQERHERLNLEVEVAYFPLPNLPLAALAREVRVRDLSGRSRELEWLDGVSRLLPFGLDQQRIKNIPRHIEAMMGVAEHRGVPLFRLKQTPDDSERVGRIEGGNFYLVPGLKLGRGLIVDPEAIFGEGLAYDQAWDFAARGAEAVLAAPEHRENKTPCAFALRQERLEAGGEVRLRAVLGNVRRDEDLDPLLASLKAKGFLEKKREENSRLIAEISGHAFCATSSEAFDAYAGQTFLDNVVRGGMPRMFQTAGGPSAFYLYSRQNVDLERDYHFFVLEPSYLSQGTGHYRSVLQNRRTDCWFFPEVEDANLVTFLNLLQLDGYNPLEVNGLSYRAVDAGGLRRWLKRRVAGAEERAKLFDWMQRSFTPGELVLRLERLGLSPEQREAALREALALCRENELGGLHEGFWVDHWHYNLDLLDAYRMVFPERLEALLLGEGRYTFFDDPDIVLPRAQRCVEAGPGRVRNYGPVWRDPEKVRRLATREADRYVVRSRNGSGPVYRTSLLVKLLTVLVNRLATLDPLGRGVEMEAGKPGWNDSMNGLPALFGSGTPESIELRRAVRLLLSLLRELPVATGPIPVFEEFAGFLRELGAAMLQRLESRRGDAAFAYWDASNRLKEDYRERTRFGVSGGEEAMDLEEITSFLETSQRLLDLAYEGKARKGLLSPEGVPYTYFVNEVSKHAPLGEKSRGGDPLVRPLAFRQRPVRLFLEGPVHWMRDRPEEARAVYQAVRRSKIWDAKLKMYKACEPMEGETPELGRAVGAYPPGWIENESIYLHMEYKYLLEVLRSGLCAEFWRDARTALVPFLDPQVYGRSTLEGASFIVSSAYADPARHGQAFQPRLSGITCEFLHMWILAMAGEAPLRVGLEGLELALSPRLPGWLFTEAAQRRRFHDPVDGWQELELPKGSVAFKLFNRALVVYRNPSRKDTFGPGAATPASYRVEYRDGREVECVGPALPRPHAEAVRRGEVRRLTVSLR